MKSLRFLVAVMSALAGVLSTMAFTSACMFSEDCNCPAPRSVATGEFAVRHIEINASTPAESLMDLEVGKLVITDDAATIHYKNADGEAGSATYTFSARY